MGGYVSRNLQVHNARAPCIGICFLFALGRNVMSCLNSYNLYMNTLLGLSFYGIRCEVHP
jgi:hypothetical protein